MTVEVLPSLPWAAWDDRRPSANALSREILKPAPALRPFVDVEPVEPTKNAAERGLRSAAPWRKGSFGRHSPGGSRFAEWILTVAVTL